MFVFAGLCLCVRKFCSNVGKGVFAFADVFFRFVLLYRKPFPCRLHFFEAAGKQSFFFAAQNFEALFFGFIVFDFAFKFVYTRFVL